MKLIRHNKYTYQWIDCMSEDTWTNESDLDSLIDSKLSQVFENVGYFIKEHKGYYLFSAGLNMVGSDVKHYYSITLIPKGQVIKIKQIKK